MIVALLNQKGGVGKTTLALHLAGQSARKEKQSTLIDTDPQSSALDWSEQRARRRFDRLFGVIVVRRDPLHCEVPGLVRQSDHIIIDGPPGVAALRRPALLADDLGLIPALPSPFERWASAEMSALVADTRVFSSTLGTHSTPVQRVPSSPAKLPTASSSAIYRRATRIGQRIIFAEAARTGQVVFERDDSGLAAREIAALASETARLVPVPRAAATAVSHRGRVTTKTGLGHSSAYVATDIYTARLTVDITPGLRGRIKIAAFQRSVTVADRGRDLLAREFPDPDRGRL